MKRVLEKRWGTALFFCFIIKLFKFRHKACDLLQRETADVEGSFSCWSSASYHIGNTIVTLTHVLLNNEKIELEVFRRLVLLDNFISLAKRYDISYRGRYDNKI
ncbi:hypothetical protein HAX54_036446 [Datura stramonium]|uniref:Uncharacterized protein n=1 Tax=Datura stramonium TaxID=4076 RepID=A0ABS8SG33_DATST|nr:hypothetical protein [Datura stramonium]